MEKEFVTHEIALALKELGFDEHCLAYYKPYYEKGVITYPILYSFMQTFDEELETYKSSELDSDTWKDYLLAPLWQQVIDWFREKYEIDIYPEPTYSLTEYNFKIITIQGKSKRQEYFKEMNKTYSFQEAREQAILKAIELIKK